MAYSCTMATTLLTTTEAAERLGVTRQGFMRMVDAGKIIAAQRVGARQQYLFDVEAVEALAQERAA